MLLRNILIAALALPALAACASTTPPLIEAPAAAPQDSAAPPEAAAPLEEQSESPAPLPEARDSSTVLFADGSSELTDDARAILDHQADWLLVMPDASAVIEGFSSDAGDRAIDRVLAERRAQAVADYLRSRGVPQNRIRTRSYGQESQNPQGETGQRRADVNVAYRVAAGAGGVPLPSFPWPAPEPTDWVDLSSFAAAHNQMQVNDALVRALQAAGYGQRWSYYAIPNGFALVARIEHLNADASPAAERFGLSESERRAPGLIGAVWGAFFPRVGYYRQVVFLVTNRSWRSSDAAELTAERAEQILRNGADSLPAEFQNRPFGADYRVTALIYEFIKREGEVRTRASDPNSRRNPALVHLDKAEISQNLRR